jgi:hypothetical protein
MRRFGFALIFAALFFAAFAGPARAADDQDCFDFPSQAAAQQHLRQDPSDPDNLDPDGDGIACETNAAPFDTVPVNTNATVVRQPASTTTTAPITTTTTVVATDDLANSGPPAFVWAIAALGAAAVLAGSSMRGRRAEGAHWV